MANANGPQSERGAPSSSPVLPAGVKLDSLPPPPELAELDSGWGEAEAAPEVPLPRLAELPVADAQAADVARLLAFRDRRIAELEAELAASHELVATLRAELERRAAPREVGDDLQAIRGIGPKLAMKLAELGITRYAELAALRPHDITALAPQLGIHAKRIEREAWVESARALVNQQRSDSRAERTPQHGG